MPLDVVEFATARLEGDVAACSGRAAVRLRTLRMLIGEESPLCTCDEADSPPIDPYDRHHILPHHYDCPAYEIARAIAAADSGHPDFNEDWSP
ncbi:hypothetical protein OG756_41850 (plasmid) [Streptomyces sp. NBC_01310]|uniref:hypothetical protein n=1 Tax=Streptomyces sp. NBC_01310 TaxID=2903820 RepID=UPI0035B5BBD3|nr:hypothetical protein OG756_41850 [Streptomyces sp. NBC_01310]